ncbi:MAG: hypothetical protein DWQ08_07240 [Proteobacteria bacterium]|nr:MAG: hypothetical protein DWQ08_07240 [Pseudomonadota bacterium]
MSPETHNRFAQLALNSRSTRSNEQGIDGSGNVCGAQPIFDAIDTTTAQKDGYSVPRSWTWRTAALADFA